MKKTKDDKGGTVPLPGHDALGEPAAGQDATDADAGSGGRTLKKNDSDADVLMACSTVKPVADPLMEEAKKTMLAQRTRISIVSSGPKFFDEINQRVLPGHKCIVLCDATRSKAYKLQGTRTP